MLVFSGRNNKHIGNAVGLYLNKSGIGEIFYYLTKDWDLKIHKFHNKTNNYIIPALYLSYPFNYGPQT